MGKFNFTKVLILCVGFFFIPAAFSMAASRHRTAVSTQTEEMIFPKNRALYAEAQSYRTEEPDPVIVDFQNSEMDHLRKTNVDRYLKKVVRTINANASDDFHKAKMICDLLALVMDYDVRSYFSGDYPSQDYRTALSSGLAVCEGFSNVFFELCTECGVKCRIVSGYARGASVSLKNETKMPSGTNHAWNIVTIDDMDYIVDSTWIASFLEGSKATKDYDMQWLFPYPEAFIYSHYPEKKSDQLLDAPISRDFFYTLPSLKPRFFDAVKSISGKIECIDSCDGTLEYVFSLADKKADLSLNIKDADSKQSIGSHRYFFAKQSSSKRKLMMSFPKKGMYEVSLFNGDSYLGEFYVKSSSGSEVLFPYLKSDFFDVIESWPGRLDRAISCDGILEYDFSLVDSDADLSLTVKDADSSESIKGNRYIFESQSPSETKLMISFPKKGLYEISLFNGDTYLGKFYVTSNSGSEVFFPDLKPEFFDVIESWPGRLDRAISCDGTLEYDFSLVDSDVELTLSIENQNSSTKLDSTRYFIVNNPSTQETKVMLSFPKAGMYTVNLFGDHQYLGCFVVKSTGASQTKFPQTYSGYGFEDVGVLNAPLISPLEKGETVFFSVQSKREAVEVLIVDSRTNEIDWIPLEKKGKRTFEGNVYIPKSAKEVRVSAKKLHGTSYETLAEFELE